MAEEGLKKSEAEASFQNMHSQNNFSTNYLRKFIIGDEKVVFEEDIKVLMMSSPVFLQMFFGSFREEGPVHIPDTTPDAFSVMMKFLQNERFMVPKDNIVSIMYLAEKYMIDKLKMACIKTMQPVTVATLSSVLNCAILYNVEELKQEAMRIFSEVTSVVLRDESSFNLLSIEALIFILQCEIVEATSEYQLFNAVFKWAESLCIQQGLPCDGENLRQQLGVALKYIRWLVMPSDEFSKVKSSNVLTSQELEEYDKYTNSRGAVKPKHLCPIAKPREYCQSLNFRVPIQRTVVPAICLADASYTCTSQQSLTELFDVKSTLYLQSIILPTQIVTPHNRGCTYLEEFTLKISEETLVGTRKNFNKPYYVKNVTCSQCVHFRTEVLYGKEIRVIISARQFEELSVMRVSICFFSPGSYPFYAKRNFSSRKIAQQTGGVILGFEFTEI